VKKILLIGVIIVLVISGFVILEYNKPHRLAENEKAVANISAMELFEAFDTDEVQADKSYLDKTIIVSGKLNKVQKDEQKYMLILDAGIDFFGISCSLADSYSNKELPVKIGTQVKIKGICKGFLDDVVLTGCIIVD